MTAVEKTIPGAAKNPQAPAKVRFQEFISCLRLVWKRKITNQSAFLVLKNWVWWKAANAAEPGFPALYWSHPFLKIAGRRCWQAGSG
jgi:hypothetical protein